MIPQADSATPRAVDIGLAQLDLLRANMPLVLLGNLVVSSLVAWAVWDMLEHSGLFSWVGLIWAISFLRIALERGVLRRLVAGLSVSGQTFLYALLSGVSGVLWGSTAVVFVDYSNPVLTALFILLLAGMTAASVASLSPRIVVYWSYAIPTMLPSAVMLGIHDAIPAGSVLVVVFLLVNLGYSRVLQRAFTANIEQRFENLDLVEQLSQQKQVAEQASLAKSRFLASASHDLRQPLTALELFLGSLGDTINSPEQHHLLKRARQSSASLQELLNSLLDISRLDAQAVRPALQPVSLGSLLRSLGDEFQPEVKEKGVTLHAGKCPHWVLSDPVLLQRMLRNLLSNAVRYTHAGVINVSCNEASGRIELRIRDTGIGIPGEQQRAVFDEFHQVDNPERDRRQGLGLGLAIVRRLSVLLDHPVMLQSVEGKGSCFTLSLPGAKPTKDDISIRPDSIPGDWHGPVLVLDDEVEVREALATTLEGWGMPVHAVADGGGAEKIISEGEFVPQLLISDYRLAAGEDGLATAQKLVGVSAAPLRVLMLTGDTDPKRVSELDRSGLPWLHKPVSAEALRNKIQAVMQDQGE